MNKQELNKTYYQTHQAQIKNRRNARYQAQKQLTKTQAKKQASDYYQAANIQILCSLKDYLASSAAKQKLWYRFTKILSQIKESVSDIVEIMRLKEVTEDLITDYWTTVKKQQRLTKSWTKLTFDQQQAQRQQWAKQLIHEEKELFQKLAQEETKQKQKTQAQNTKKQAQINAYWNQTTTGKIACPDCGKMVQQLDSEHNICTKCLKNYEQ